MYLQSPLDFLLLEVPTVLDLRIQDPVFMQMSRHQLLKSITYIQSLLLIKPRLKTFINRLGLHGLLVSSLFYFRINVSGIEYVSLIDEFYKTFSGEVEEFSKVCKNVYGHSENVYSMGLFQMVRSSDFLVFQTSRTLAASGK